VLSVTDTGMGMDAATQGQIFEPFFTTKGPGQGTGLGLSTVFGIVRQCGGHISIETAPGRGASFAINLPRVEDKADDGLPAPEVTELGGNETILLVEDEASIRAVVRIILGKLGYRVIETTSVEDALARSAEHDEIALLLTDVVMPHMSGPELAKHILRERPGIKVLCMSGYTDDALVRHGAHAMGMAYLQKPITPTKLARKVRTVLDAR
jgi:CheY-like chemotaxis protein